MNDKVEIIEYIDKNGVVFKKTANGIDIPLGLYPLPTYCMTKFFVTPEELKEIWGDEVYKKVIK